MNLGVIGLGVIFRLEEVGSGEMLEVVVPEGVWNC